MRETASNFFLPFYEISPIAFKPIGPKLRAAFRIDQLNIDLNMVAGALHAAIENVAHPELASDLLRTDGFALVSERSHGRDHEAPRNPRQVGGEIFGDRIGEILLVWIVR